MSAAISNQNLSVYSASAGSGKTYTIAHEYISMMLENTTNPSKAYRNILAVTFTNKACEEMKSRIILNLYNIGQVDTLRKKQNITADEQKLLDNTLGIILNIAKQTHLTENEIIRRSKNIFTQILHDYSYFSIHTIDSFFQKIVRNLTYELDIQQNYELELNNELVVSHVVDELMLKSESDPALKKQIWNLIKIQIDEDKRWSPKELIQDFLKQALDNYYQPTNLDFVTYKADIEKNTKDITNNLISLLNDINALVTSSNPENLSGKSGSSYSYFKKYYTEIEDFKKLANYICEKYKEDQLCGEWFKAKAPFKCDDSFNAIGTQFNKLVEDLRTNKVIYKNLDLAILLNSAYKELNDLLDYNSLFLLSQVPSLLADIIKTGEDFTGSIAVMPFIFEKIGTAYKNYLIDEFQDTSKIQWNIFKLMLEEALSQNDRSIIVGDTKQSIYAWRGGDWSILNGLHPANAGRINSFVDIKNLGNNFRTAKNIVEFNNDFFSKIHEHVPNDNSGSLPSIYQNVAQKPNGQKIGGNEVEGEIKVGFFDAEKLKKEDYQEAIFEVLAKQIVDLQSDFNVEPQQITILVRGTNDAKFLVNKFLSHPAKIPVVSNESLYLVNNQAIRLILAYMRYLLNYKDELSLAEAAFLYHKEKFKVSDSANFDNKIYLDELNEALGNDCLLQTKQAFEVVDILISRLQLNNNEANVPFLIAFRNLVHDYSAKSTGLQAFMDYWNERGYKETLKLPETQNAIKIITIHKSKGLEADYIFVPFCNWTFTSNSNNNTKYLFVNEPYRNLGIIPVVKNKELANTVFKDSYSDYLEKESIEAYNLLYVAFTRAKYGLYAYSYKNSESMFDLLKKYFEIERSGWTVSDDATSSNVPYTIWQQGSLIAHTKKAAVSQDERLIKLYPVNEGNAFAIKHHFNDNFDDIESNKRLRGIMLHKMFEEIYTAADIDKIIERKMLNGEIDVVAADNLKNELKGKLQLSPLNEFFSDEAKVYNERSIINPELQKLKRPDRVMYFDDRIVVLDYKFGKMNNVKYASQMRDYSKLLTKIDDKLPVEMYIWYYFENKLIKVTAERLEEIYLR